MNSHAYPVFTVDAECQDCYKCVRRCPVKAIKVKDGHAAVMPELCIACGKCVEVCPVKAKQVRNGVGRARFLLSEDLPVYASIAPSWVSEFNQITPGQLIRALKLLGFTGVSETALGAQIVSSTIARTLDLHPHGLMISSACPTSVDYICKYMSEFADKITPVSSPLLAHCRYLRDHFGNDIRVIFIGPCISKKNEADKHPDLLNLALTYPELRQMLRENGIDPTKLVPEDADQFVPKPAEEGARYPIEGGMNDTIQFQTTNRDIHYMTLSGLHNITLALNGLKEIPPNETVFLETLACPGGCVHGPCAEHDSPGLLERLRVLNYAKFPAKPEERRTPGAIAAEFKAQPVPEDTKDIGLEQISDALRSIGKTVPEDELNCDGCGYDTCRNFARALIAGNAEPSMCVSYLKKQAQKKANALLRSISSGVVIVDKYLQIVECNQYFANLFGPEVLAAYEACPGLTGADLERIVPFSALFSSAIQTGHDVHRDSLKVGERLFSINIFTIDSHEIVGAIIFDVTSVELHREQIAERAREVIDRNIATVQEIACRLGEQMADTELLLRSIADTYADDKKIVDPAISQGDTI